AERPADGAAGEKRPHVGVAAADVGEQLVQFAQDFRRGVVLLGGVEQGLGVDAGQLARADIGLGFRDQLLQGVAHIFPPAWRTHSWPASLARPPPLALMPSISFRASSTSRRW